MHSDASKRPVNNDDLFLLRWVDAPCLSADGRHLAHTVTFLDREADCMRTEVRWGGRSQPGHAPAWSPRGARLAYIDAAGRIRFWDASGDALVQPAVAPGNCTQFAWAPNSSGLACLAQDRLWIHWLGELAWHQASQTLADPANLVWHPDGRTLFLTSTNSVDGESRVLRCDVHQLQQTPDELVRNAGPIRALTGSPDGRALAWIGHARGLAQGVNNEVWFLDVETRRARSLTAGFDFCAGLSTRADDVRGMNPPNLRWVRHNEGDRIYFVHQAAGASHVSWVNLERHLQPVVTGDRSCLAFDIAAQADRIAIVLCDATRPGDVHVCDLDGNDERALTDENHAWLMAVHLVPLQACGFAASDGAHVDAWLLKPEGFTAKKHPVVVEIHGGPHYALGHRFYFEFQRLVAKGYAVIFGNARGSQGYGEQFATEIRGAWGGRDRLDVMEMVDHGLRDADLDPLRVALTGVSYGAYLTHCIIGQTHRFRAAITENGISNLVSNFAGTSNQRFWEWELEGTPETQPERYHQLSPIHLAHQVQTPLLMIHAEQDENCPIGQSEELLAALRAAGCPSGLVRIPGEGHLMNLVGKPGHRIQRTDALDAWLDKWLGGLQT